MTSIERKWTLDLNPDDGRVLGLRYGHGLETWPESAESVEVVPASQVQGAVEVDNAMVERLRESLWSTWGAGRQTTDWPTRAQLHAALDAALASPSSDLAKEADHG